MGQTLEKLGGSGIASALVGPEPHIDGLGGKGFGIGRAAIEAVPLRQGLFQSLGQKSGIACAAAVNNGITHDCASSFLS